MTETQSIKMAKTSQMQIRLDDNLKTDAEDILSKIGLSPTEYVRMSLRQLVMRKGIPFDARVFNDETVEALKESIGDAPGYSDPRSMMSDILAESD